jgi:hypothetical protein
MSRTLQSQLPQAGDDDLRADPLLCASVGQKSIKLTRTPPLQPEPLGIFITCRGGADMPKPSMWYYENRLDHLTSQLSS